ncbi:MAG: phosphoglycerate mutase family protein [Ruminococcus sp.]|nr:phosphoglycerate mutase family protein [Ruminococcus sp.]
MKNYKIRLIRHGMTSANSEGRYIGVTDTPLSADGIKQLYEKADKLYYPQVQKVYTSPLKRCKQTADILYHDAFTVELGLLAEMNFGDFENKRQEQLYDEPAFKQWIEGGIDAAPPGGESARDVMNRCYEALNIIISDMMYEGFTEAAVITHSGIIVNMLSCFGVPKLRPADYCCDFGEGFEIGITAAMWQRSGAFELLGRFPCPAEENEEGEED